MKIKNALFPMFLILNGCTPSANDDNFYTLYRTSPIDTNSRIHVATFDADEKNNYNRENCSVAQELFASQKGIITKFWCEKGRYRK